MITFYELGGLGRLGNQLFQYAATRALSLKNGYEIKIPNPTTRNWHGQDCLLDKFNIEAGSLQEEDLKGIEYQYNEPDYMFYDSDFTNLPDNGNLSGFFQSTYYFLGFDEQIRKELTPKDEFLTVGAQRISEIKKNNPGYEIVSLHLRRGDNTDNSNPSPELNEMYGKSRDLELDSFYGKYFVNAKKKFAGQKVKFLIFSGGSRQSGNDNESDIDWCKRNFTGDEFLFAEGGDSMTDFCSIMSCDHNILSHISSFGWWAAFLNQNKDKKVVAPLRYHPDMPYHTYREGFYPENWIIV